MAFIYLFHFNSFLTANFKKLKKGWKNSGTRKHDALRSSHSPCPLDHDYDLQLFRTIGLEQKFV